MTELTELEKDLLQRMGYTKNDISYIEEDSYYYRTFEGERTTKEKVIEMIGTIGWLSGIGRARFHSDASCSTDKGKGVYIYSKIWNKIRC